MLELELVKSACIKPVTLAFQANLNRTLDFAMLPAEMAFQNRRDALFQSNALFRTTGKCEQTIDEMLDTEQTPELDREFRKQAAEFEAKGTEKRKEYMGPMGVVVTELMARMNPGMQSSIDALFVSIVLESWLFFEAFCSDLWVASVDNSGKSISNRLGVFHSWNNPEEKLTPEDAVNLEFNAKTHYGSYLRETGKVSFIKLQLIRKFYGAAFGSDAEKSIDNADAGRILVLSKIRNCIVHSAGRIDKDFKKFLEQSPRFPELNQFKGKERILLTGGFVKALRHSALETGVALAKHVDAILQSGG